MENKFILRGKKLLLTYHDNKNLLSKDKVLEAINQIIAQKQNLIVGYYIVCETNRITDPSPRIFEHKDKLNTHYHILLILEYEFRSENCHCFDFVINNTNFHGNYRIISQIVYSNKSKYSLNKPKNLEQYKSLVQKNISSLEYTLIYLLKEDNQPYVKGFNLEKLAELYQIRINLLEYKVSYCWEDFNPKYDYMLSSTENLNPVISNKKEFIPDKSTLFKGLTLQIDDNNKKFPFKEENTICICAFKDKNKLLELILGEGILILENFNDFAKERIEAIVYLTSMYKKTRKKIELEQFFLHVESHLNDYQLRKSFNNSIKKLYIFCTNSEEQTKNFKNMTELFKEEHQWLNLNRIELIDIIQQNSTGSTINIINNINNNTINNYHDSINFNTVIKENNFINKVEQVEDENIQLRNKINKLEELNSQLQKQLNFFIQEDQSSKLSLVDSTTLEHSQKKELSLNSQGEKKRGKQKQLKELKSVRKELNQIKTVDDMIKRISNQNIVEEPEEYNDF
jgi:hypothetical protein